MQILNLEICKAFMCFFNAVTKYFTRPSCIQCSCCKIYWGTKRKELLTAWCPGAKLYNVSVQHDCSKNKWHQYFGKIVWRLRGKSLTFNFKATNVFVCINIFLSINCYILLASAYKNVRNIKNILMYYIFIMSSIV